MNKSMWIDNKGVRPELDDTHSGVDIMFRDGDISENKNPDDYIWGISTDDCDLTDIVKYRYVFKETTEFPEEERIDVIGQNGNDGEHYDQRITNMKEINSNNVSKNKQVHPLLNPDSPHYKILGDESIEQFEKMFTIDELKAWAKITYYKYMFRLGKKDDVEKELHKMKTYEDYYNYLIDISSTSE